jgi:hypothetical protein
MKRRRNMIGSRRDTSDLKNFNNKTENGERELRGGLITRSESCIQGGEIFSVCTPI